MPITGFQDLDVWRAAHELTLASYKLSGDFPKSEVYGMASQLRRAAASVPSNIAEGWGRRSTKEYLRYLSIAHGSLQETRYFLLLAKDLSYCSSERQQELEMLVNRIGAMLAGLERSLKAKVLTAGVKTEVAEEDADK
jgi:four helix bundle protein